MTWKNCVAWASAMTFIACGSSNQISLGEGPGVAVDSGTSGTGASGSGGTGSPAAGGTGAAGAGGADASGGSSGTAGSSTDSGTGESDDCGDGRCADYTGEKTFILSGAPSDSPQTFASGTTHPPGTSALSEPIILYPNHETRFPINASRLRHAWLAGQNDLFKLVFVGPRTTVYVYTAALSFMPSAEQWDWLAESNRGSEVRFHIEALSSLAPREVWASRTISLFFARVPIEGSVYYWSTTAKALMRAALTSPFAQKFYTPPRAALPDNTCVGCHTLSPDGSRLALAYGGYGAETLREIDVASETAVFATPAPPSNRNLSGAWSTFSPDGKFLVSAVAGRLELIDADTGTTLTQSGGMPIPTSSYASHPNWSPAGNKLAFTLASKGSDREVQGGSIATLDYASAQFGALRILVPSARVDDNNFFPSFSPDGKWIAYVHADNRSSRDARSATLHVIASNGGSQFALDRLNGRVNNNDGQFGVGNSMPIWAPANETGVFWLTFSSLRAYADVRPEDPKLDQLWMAAFDPALPDPGYAAFWAPFQSLDQGNHRAFWTSKAEAPSCACVEQCGDSIDNDCDGAIDEPDCVNCQPHDVCGDSTDNDCDCVVDDGCNVEICGDGIDNDGDGLIDSNDPSCQSP